eukprot:7930699-Pyramimonas_sp.AAC.3
MVPDCVQCGGHTNRVHLGDAWRPVREDLLHVPEIISCMSLVPIAQHRSREVAEGERFREENAEHTIDAPRGSSVAIARQLLAFHTCTRVSIKLTPLPCRLERGLRSNENLLSVFTTSYMTERITTMIVLVWQPRRRL